MTCTLISIHHGTFVEHRNESCECKWNPRNANVHIHYLDRDGVRETSTIDEAVGSGDILDVHTQNSIYRFKVENASSIAKKLNELRAEWAVMRGVAAFVAAFA